jgi:hypothetical protein
MTKARPRTIRLDKDIDKALDVYVEKLKKLDSSATYNSVINEFCSDRLILGTPSIIDRLQSLEAKIAKIDAA